MNTTDSTIMPCGNRTDSLVTTNGAFTASSLGAVSPCWYWPYQELYPPASNIQYWYNVVPPLIDHDLLAQKIVDKLKGEENKSVEDIRKELNRLIDQLSKK